MSIAGWLRDVQGYLRVLDGSNTPAPRRASMKFVGPNVSDDGLNTVVDMTSTGIGTDALATALAPHLRGLELTVDASGNLTPRLRPRIWRLREDWNGGSPTVSGAIGQHGWNFSGVGTPAVSRPGSFTCRAATSGATNDLTAVHLTDAAGSTLTTPAAATGKQCHFIARLPALTTRRTFYGWIDSFANIDTPARALGFVYDSSVSPNWHLWARNSSTGAPSNTGLVVPSNTRQLLSFVSNGTSWLSYIDGVLAGTLSANIPSTSCNLGFAAKTLAASSATADIHLLSIEHVLAAPWDLDTFLDV